MYQSIPQRLIFYQNKKASFSFFQDFTPILQYLGLRWWKVVSSCVLFLVDSGDDSDIDYNYHEDQDEAACLSSDSE